MSRRAKTPIPEVRPDSEAWTRKKDGAAAEVRPARRRAGWKDKYAAENFRMVRLLHQRTWHLYHVDVLNEQFTPKRSAAQ